MFLDELMKKYTKEGHATEELQARRSSASHRWRSRFCSWLSQLLAQWMLVRR